MSAGRLPLPILLALASAQQEQRAAATRDVALSLGVALLIDRETFDFEVERMAEGLGGGPGGLTEHTSALELACRFLREQLRDGPRPSAELRALAAERGIDRGSLQRAKRELRIQHRRVGVPGKWGGRGAKFIWFRDPAERRAEARARILDFLLEVAERDDLTAETRAELKRIRDEVAREGLAEARPA
jgi:hypothetical protein